MQDKIKFFKGPSNKLDSAQIQSGSFYLTEDTNDMYYATNNNTLIAIFSNPKKRIQKIQTYYSTVNSNKPISYPPNEKEWKTTFSDYIPGQPGYSVECTLFMDGTYQYSTIKDYITDQDIDLICTIPGLGTSLVGDMKLNNSILNKTINGEE